MPRVVASSLPASRYDYSTFFARSGLLSVMGGPKGNMPDTIYRTGLGDMPTSLALLGGVLSALHLRHRTGKGSLVETSLFRNAAYIAGMDMANALADGLQPPPRSLPRGRPAEVKAAPSQPMILLNRMYTTADDRYILMIMPIKSLAMRKYWPRFCDALGHPEWLEEDAPCPSEAAVEALFRSRPYADWLAHMRTFDMTVGPVQARGPRRWMVRAGAPARCQ